MNTETIRRDGKDYPAVCCPRCGGKVYPVDKMALHLETHQLKDLLCKPNREQRAFARAGRSKWT